MFLKKTTGASDKSRFGFIVGKKVSNKATVRNKIRRKIREVVSEKINELKGKTDNVIVVLPGFSEKEFVKIELDVKKILEKAKLI